MANNKKTTQKTTTQRTTQGSSAQGSSTPKVKEDWGYKVAPGAKTDAQRAAEEKAKMKEFGLDSSNGIYTMSTLNNAEKSARAIADQPRVRLDQSTGQYVPSPTETQQDPLAFLKYLNLGNPTGPGTTSPTKATTVGTQAASPPANAGMISTMLPSMGYEVSWDPNSKTVLVNGTPINTTGMQNVNGRFYATPAQLDQALAAAGIKPTSVVPTTTPTGAPTGPTGTTPQDPLMDMLMGLLNGKPQATTAMSQADASAQAQRELNPEYDQAVKELTRLANLDLEKRGIFNSPLATGIVADKSATLEAGRQAAIAKRAADLVSLSQDQANESNKLFMQDRDGRINALLGTLGYLSNQKFNEAGLTGVYNGQQTLASKDQAAKYTGYYNGTETLEKKAIDADNRYKALQAEFSQAALTGKFRGDQTLAAQELALSQYSTKLNGALQRLQSLGKVASAEDAKLLGVPVGTASFQAANAIADRQQQWSLAVMELNARAADRRASMSGSADPFKNLSKDLAVWELTGVAPDTPALRAYGIAPGTEFKQTPQQKLDALKAEAEASALEAEKKFQTEVNSLSGTYKIDSDSASVLASLLTNPDRKSAFTKFNAQRDVLRKQGVNVAMIETILNQKYPATSSTASGYQSTNPNAPGYVPFLGGKY